VPALRGVRSLGSPRRPPARRSKAPQNVGDLAIDPRALVHDYVRMNELWLRRLRSLLDELERIEADQRSALLAVLNPGEAVVAPRRQVPAGLKSLVEAYERTLILRALASAGGSQKQAAASLGVPHTTLNEKIKRLGIRLPGAAS
jgi:transcriptional regulator with GAF, ATPase, and Fis domain